MREYVIEDAFRDEVAKRGGLALKLTSQTMNGLPDRLVLLLGGKAAFVELKAPGKTMRPLQIKRKEQLEALGFPVFCVDRFEQIRPVLDTIETRRPGEQKLTAGAAIPRLQRVEYPAFREDDPFKTRFGDPFPEFGSIDDPKATDKGGDAR
ncbi:MAG: VRR-NUC domain-containing protein [Synergistaceae bacterium]|nr:VRR-NUC domain-containing protein [Synergistaceae bacterium]